MPQQVVMEVLEGTSMVSPGGVVDSRTASAKDASLWERWALDQLVGLEMLGTAQPVAGARASG